MTQAMQKSLPKPIEKPLGNNAALFSYSKLGFVSCEDRWLGSSVVSRGSGARMQAADNALVAVYRECTFWAHMLLFPEPKMLVRQP